MMKNGRLAHHTSLIKEGPDLRQVLKDLTEVIEVLNAMAFQVKGDLEAQRDSAMKKAFPKAIKRVGATGGSDTYLPVRPFEKAKDPNIDLAKFENPYG